MLKGSVELKDTAKLGDNYHQNEYFSTGYCDACISITAEMKKKKKNLKKEVR